MRDTKDPVDPQVIAYVKVWAAKLHTAVNYHLTQLLMAHGRCHRSFWPRLAFEVFANFP